MKKTFSLILCLCFIFSCMGVLSACGTQGPKGEKGEAGADGNTPFIGGNGNWWIGETDTGVFAGGANGNESAEAPNEGEKTKVEISLKNAAFSSKNVQMIEDKQGVSYLFNAEKGSEIEIIVKKPGNRFRIYASIEKIPAEKFSQSGYRADADIIHTGDDSLTGFTYKNSKYQTFMVYMSNTPDAKPEIEVFMTLRENAAASENSAQKSAAPFVPWYCPTQPSALGGPDSFADGNWDANQIIENLYEPLRKAYPHYITRENIGKDSSGKYDMWKYVFTPASYNQTIYVQSGVHNREKAALLGLARFLQLLCTQWDSSESMAYLYANVRIVVVPIVNPWGISQENPKNDANINGVNLNRDLDDKVQQQETLNVLKVLNEYKDVLSFAIDYHTTVNSTYGDYAILCRNTAQPNAEISDDIVAFLAQKNIEGTPDLHYHGISSNAETYLWYFWNKLGIPACTLEHADYRWDKNSKYSAVCMTRSVELIGNVILNYARQEFKLHEKVNNFFD